MKTNEIICLELVKAESEQEVIQILKKHNLWDDSANWQFFGGEENNFSVIGNQQSRPESAIVEKFINSVDAVLMAECLKRNIDPTSSAAPESIRKALQEYFGVFEGKLTNITPTERSKLADKIGFVATGSKRDPNYVIYDFGEGQSPAKLPDTILSIRKSNKLRIPFVQGKFNMGGTGVFRFCGDHNIQLIISKRNPEVAIHETDPSKEKWGFTIIRREDPKQGMRSSSYKYLAPSNQILSFDAASLPILPSTYPKPYERPMGYGTFLKMYNYKIGPRLWYNVQMDLSHKLNLLMPQLALPIRMYERRSGHTGHSFEKVISGLSVRVDEDRSDNVEDGFPTTGSMTVSGQSMKYSIYAFKRDKQKTYANDEGVIFTINGQTHGHLTKAFFSRQKVGMSYLQQSILVMLDCSEIEGRAREDLFMNSRDRLSNDTLRFEIEAELEEIIKNHPGLRELKDKRRREDVEHRLSDQKPLADVLKDILNTSPTLSKLFVLGQQLQNPFYTQPAAPTAVFVGKKFPTFFTLEKKFPIDKPKQAHLGSRFRVTYKTDVVNDYFDRAKDQGKFKAFINDAETDVDVNLWNGFGYLNVNLTGYAIGEQLKIRTEVMDINRSEPITEEFYVLVTEPQQRPAPSTAPSRRRPGEPAYGTDETQPAGFALPTIIELSKDGRTGHNWDEHGFDKNSALKVLGSEEDGYDFFLNIDNLHLRTEIRGAKPEDALSIEGKYKFGQVLLGLAMLKDATKLESAGPESPGMSIFELIEKSSQAWSPVIIPMIDNLSALDLSSEAEPVLEEVI